MCTRAEYFSIKEQKKKILEYNKKIESTDNEEEDFSSNKS